MVVGTCSNCGGQVERDMEGNLHCRRCGATKSILPVIPMPPPPKYPFPKNPYPIERIKYHW